MLRYGSISSHPFHVAALALARVPECSIGAPLILIAICLARRARKQKHIRVGSWRRNTALTLPAVYSVNLIAAVVNSAYIEWDHCLLTVRSQLYFATAPLALGVTQGI